MPRNLKKKSGEILGWDILAHRNLAEHPKGEVNTHTEHMRVFAKEACNWDNVSNGRTPRISSHTKLCIKSPILIAESWHIP